MSVNRCNQVSCLKHSNAGNRFGQSSTNAGNRWGQAAARRTALQRSGTVKIVARRHGTGMQRYVSDNKLTFFLKRHFNTCNIYSINLCVCIDHSPGSTEWLAVMSQIVRCGGFFSLDWQKQQ